MRSLLGLPPLVQFFLIFCVFGLIGILGPALVRQRGRNLSGKEHHDVLGIMFSVAAAFYGVVLAFVIVAAWQNFQDASAHEQIESLALTELYAVSLRLPPPAGRAMVAAIRDYADDALRYEWSDRPQIKPGRQQLFKILNELLSLDPQSQKQNVLYSKAMDQIARLFEARQQRLLYSQSNIPAIVWTVIIFGACVTIFLSFFFFTQHRALQGLISMLFTILIGLTIVAIYDLSHPYQGFTRISPTGFRELVADIDSRAGALPPASAAPR